jgi:hypothetical protein
VGQPDRQRHQVVGLVAGIAEHHPLVAGPLRVEDVLAALAAADLEGGIDTLGDVGRLLIDGDGDATGVTVEPIRLAVVTNVADRLADDLRDGHVGLGGDLAGDDDQTGGEERLASHPALRVLGQDGVENGV